MKNLYLLLAGELPIFLTYCPSESELNVFPLTPRQDVKAPSEIDLIEVENELKN